jgi:CheY-like chemotaxis protein
VTSTPGPLILAVEDEPRNAALLREILRRAGYPLQVTETLALARAWLADHDPDLILLDRHLPDGDGLELVAELRRSDRARRSAILLVSASVLPGDRDAAEAAGCDGFVPKPIRIRALLDEIQRHLS